MKRVRYYVLDVAALALRSLVQSCEGRSCNRHGDSHLDVVVPWLHVDLYASKLVVEPVRLMVARIAHSYLHSDGSAGVPTEAGLRDG